MMTAALENIPQQQFQKRLQHWEHRLAKGIAAQEEFFESDTPQ
jgi:hypothetical protein